MKLRYFAYKEFDSPDKPGSGLTMDPVVLGMIDAARKAYGKPIKVNSGFRTPEHNSKVGGVSNSSHLKGLAIDIACSDSNERFLLLGALLKVGFKRLGVGTSFIHVDVDPTKSHEVIWTY